jgi:putative acetyltransferase
VLRRMTHSEIVIRPASEDDVPQLVEVWFDTWHATSPDLEHPQPIELWAQRFYTEILPNETVLIAECNGYPAGFMALREAEGYLHLLYVSPEYQQHGVGSLLLAEAIRRCPTGLRLTTLESNTDARAFYERRGWTAGKSTRHPRTGHPSLEYRWSPEAGDQAGPRSSTP